MTLSTDKIVILWGIVFSVAVFLSIAPHEEKPDARLLSGKQAWQKYGCSECHNLIGSNQKKGPDLGKIGINKQKEWIRDQLINPRSHTPNSIMPSYSQLSEKDIGEIIDYLSRQKGVAVE